MCVYLVRKGWEIFEDADEVLEEVWDRVMFKVVSGPGS